MNLSNHNIKTNTIIRFTCEITLYSERDAIQQRRYKICINNIEIVTINLEFYYLVWFNWIKNGNNGIKKKLNI
jgi:hypothetical protein